MSCYAIGDIHGCLKTVQELLFNIIELKAGDNLIFLGDYIDRGPDSKGVIDFLMALRANPEFKVELLLGNHEQKMLESITSQTDDEGWLHYGGRETLQSFNVSFAAMVDEKYVQFIKSLQHYTEYKNYLLVHGGFNFSIDNIFDDRHAMLWARNYDVNPEKTEGKIVIHGHTPIDEIDLKALVKADKHEINLDNGCVYFPREGRGSLFAMNVDTHELFSAKYCG